MHGIVSCRADMFADMTCNFCVGSPYSASDEVVSSCTDGPLSIASAASLSFFLGAFGGGYLYYGYDATGALTLLDSRARLHCVHRSRCDATHHHRRVAAATRRRRLYHHHFPRSTW